MRDGEDTEEDFRRQAAEYIEANREEVDGWIEQAIASAQ
jgi:ABC-type proline/glycine betaine transport system substrate-binding protein